MADDFLENALDSAPPEVQADANAMPLATETPSNAAQRVATGQRSAALYGRMKAADLATRGIPSYSTPDGQTKEITDDSGQALTSMDPKNGIAYDSTGAPVSYKGRDEGGNPVLTDPYQEAPRVTDKQGNIMSAPKGLGWRYDGQDSEVAASYQAAQDEKMNQLTASALAPYEAQAKTAASQAAKAVKASAKQTAAALAQNGVPLTDETGQPAFDLHDVDGPTLKAHIDSTFNKQYASPEANATPWFGGGQYSSDAQALRQDIDNRKAAANAAVDAHLSTLTAAQTAQDAADNLTNQRQALQASKLDYVNGLRAKAGLPPIQIPGTQQSDDQSDSQGVRNNQLPSGPSVQGTQPSTPESAIPGLGVDGSATPAAAASATESAIPGLSHEGEALMQGGVSASLSQEDHQKLSAALPPSAQAALASPKVNSDGKVQPEGFWATAGRAFGTKIIPSTATAIGGLAAGALAIESGPGAVAADIAGGAAAGYGAAKAQQAVMGKDWTAQNEAQMKANAEAHPVAAQIGTMVPFLISILGGGGGGIVKAGEGVAGRAITAEGKQAVQDAVRTGVMSTVPLAERLAQKAALGARGGAGEGVQDPNATPVSVIDSAAKGAATFGATALFAPAKTLLGAVLGTSVKDSAAMALASQIYDTAIHGQPFDLSKVAHEAGGNLPAFMLQNALLGFLTHGMARPGEPPSLPNGSGEKPITGTDRDIPPEDGGPTAGGGGPTKGGSGGGGIDIGKTHSAGPTSPEAAPKPEGFTKPVPPAAQDISYMKPEDQINLVNQRLHQLGVLKAQGVPEAQWTGEAETLRARQAELNAQIRQEADAQYEKQKAASGVSAPRESSSADERTATTTAERPAPIDFGTGERQQSPKYKSLSDLGYSYEDISGMSAREAHEKIAAAEAKGAATKFAEPQGSQETPGVAPEAAPLATSEPAKTIDDAAHEAATSPFSPKAAPTPAQIGKNATVGRFSVGGLPVSIEHPAGTSRKEGWKPLTAHYGYLRTVADSGDGEKMDVFVKTGTPEDYKGPVFVVNRHAAPDGSIDHKALVGPASREEAAKIHNQNYPEGLHVKPADIAEYSSPEAFKAWAQSADQHKEPAPGDTPITKETNEPTKENTPASVSAPAQGGKAQVEPAAVEGDGERGGEAPVRATADEVASHIQKLRKGALKSRFDLLQTRLERVAPGYAGRPEESSGLKTMVNPRTEKLEIWHDPEAIAHSVGVIEDNWKARGKSPQEARARALDAIKASVQEELIHSSQRVFERGGPQFEATYAKFWRNDVPKVVRDIFTAMRNTKGESDAQKAAEFERMLIQFRESDTITEALFGDPFLESQFERLKPFLQSIQSPTIEDNISRVMTLVAEHGEPEAKAAPAAKEEESAIPGIKKDRGPPEKPAKKAPSSELEKINVPSVKPASGVSESAIEEGRKAFEGLFAAKPGDQNYGSNDRPAQNEPGGSPSRSDLETWFKAAEQEARPLAESLGARIIRTTEGSRIAERLDLERRGAAFDPTSATIYYQPSREGLVSEPLVRNIFAEELIHAAQYHLVATDAKVPPSSYAQQMEVERKYGAIVDEVAKTNKGKALILSALLAYDHGTGNEVPKVSLDAAVGFMKRHISRALEMERQLVQIRKSGEPTEASMRTAEQMLTSWFVRVLSILKRIAKEPAKTSPILADSITKVEDAIRGKNDSVALSAAKPTAIDQMPRPKEKRTAFFSLADTLEKEGVKTPVAMAKYLDDVAPGKLRGYAQALWDTMAASGSVERGTHDWSVLYNTGPEEQKKDAAAAKAKQDREQQALFSAKPVAAFYSQLSRTIDALPQQTMTVEQARAAVDKGSKKDEITMSGILTDPLSPLVDQPHDTKVTRKQLRDYAIERQATVQDVTLSQGGSVFKEGFKTREELMDHINGDDALVDESGALKPKLHISHSEEGWNLLDTGKESDQTHFSQYQLPGGELGSYREQFVTWPDEKGRTKNIAAHEKLLKEWTRANSELNQFKDEHPNPSPSEQNFIERQTAEVASLKFRSSSMQSHGWEDGHSQYSDIANPIVRIRRNIRTDTEGNKTLFLEEMQGPSASEQEKMPSGVRKRIYEIGVKRAIREAAAEGATRLGWTTGQQQAERYSLENQVSSIHAGKLDSGPNAGKYIVSAETPDGRKLPVQTLAESELEANVGKDLARKIIDEADDQPEGKTYSGVDLKVGGEGLKALYDVTLPRIANEIAKKFGAKTGTAKLGREEPMDDTDMMPQSAFEDAMAQPLAKDSADIHSLPLPEALRDKAVYEGFPLFAAKPSIAEKKPGEIPGFDSEDNLMAAEKEGLPTLHASNATIVGPGEIQLSAAKPLVAHHGTPYKVDRFSSEKIGTGEGAYAFGYGLYFAESHDAAEFYRKNISRRQSVKDGNTYTVHLDVDPNTLLDWDKDIGEQTPEVKAALSKHPVGKDFVEKQPWQSVRFVYDQLTIDKVFGRGYQSTSEGLIALGIPGVKYFDAGSREAGGGTRNYVMFDDSKIHITHENGQPVSMDDAQSGLAAAKPMSWESVTQAFHDLSEKSGWDSLVNAAQLFMSPDSRLTKEEKERFRKAGDPNAIGDARKTGIFLDGVTAEMDRRKKRWEHALKGARDLVSKLSPALQLELMKRIDEGAPLKAGPIKDAIDAVAKMDAQRVKEAKDWFDAHGQAHWKNYENFLKNVVPHYFKDATQADKVMDQFLRDKKMQGGTGFLKHRADVTMREIIEWAATQGIKLEPKHENVIDAIMDRWTQQERYFGAHEMIEQMEKNGTGHWEKADYMPRAGERMVNNIIGSRVIDGPDGHRIRQHFFADEPSARVVNNYLSRGLRADHKFVEHYFTMANRLNALQLGLSAFHAGFVTMEGMVSNFARGLESVMHATGDALTGKKGAFEKFLTGLKDMATAPFSTISDWKLGRDIGKEMLNPGSMSPDMTAMVNEMVKGGFRQGMDSFYQNQDIQRFMDAMRGTKVLSGILRAPWAAIELIAKPLMEHYVPQMKAAAIYKLAEMHLKKNPNMTAMEMRRQLQEDVRSGNNRFGQMTYDNLHLHKTVKDLLMALTRSLGWNWGTFAELGGGFVDWARFAKDAAIYGAKKVAGSGGGNKPPGGGEGESPAGDDYAPGGAKFPRVTNKMAYTLALPLLVGLFGAVLSAFFGKKPKELKDYYFVQTGDIDDHGNPVRVVLPSYMKDLFHAFRDPLSTVTNKLHPILSMIAQMLQNKDFYGVEIRHSGDPVMKQILEELKYLGKTSLPFTVTNTRKSTSPALKVAGYLGVTQAPSDAGKTNAQVLADKLNVAQIPNKARTQEDADHSALRNQIIGLERAGQPSGAALLSKSEAAGKITPKDVTYINKMAGMTRLQASVSHLSIPDAEKVLDAASPAERMEIAPLIAEKKARQARTMYAGQ